MTVPVIVQVGSLLLDQSTPDASGNLWGYESMPQWWESANTVVATGSNG